MSTWRRLAVMALAVVTAGCPRRPPPLADSAPAMARPEQPSVSDRTALTEGRPRPNAASYDTTALPRVRVSVDCRAKATKISPLIYGIAYYPFDERASSGPVAGRCDRAAMGRQHDLDVQLGARRLEHRQRLVSSRTTPAWLRTRSSSRTNASHGMASALTVPMMGWVAKDATSSSFPVSAFGPQAGDRPVEGRRRQRKGEGQRQAHHAAVPPRAPTMPHHARVREAMGRGDPQGGREDRAGAASTCTSSTTSRCSGARRTATCTPSRCRTTSSSQRTIDYGTAIREARSRTRSSPAPPSGAGPGTCTRPRTWPRAAPRCAPTAARTATCRVVA